MKQAAPFSSNRPFQALVRAELAKYRSVLEEMFLSVLAEFKALVLVGKVDEEADETFFDAESLSDCEEDEREGETQFVKLKNDLISMGIAQKLNRWIINLIEENALKAHDFLLQLLAIEESHISTNDQEFWRQCQKNLKEFTMQREESSELELSTISINAEPKTSVLNEFLALFQPTRNLKRVEHRPVPPNLSNANANTAQPISDELQFTLGVLKTYMSIVKRGLADAVPKAISHFLIQKTLQDLPPLLIPKIHTFQANCIPLTSEIDKLNNQLCLLDAFLIGLLLTDPCCSNNELRRTEYAAFFSLYSAPPRQFPS